MRLNNPISEKFINTIAEIITNILREKVEHVTDKFFFVKSYCSVSHYINDNVEKYFLIYSNRHDFINKLINQCADYKSAFIICAEY